MSLEVRRKQYSNIHQDTKAFHSAEQQPEPLMKHSQISVCHLAPIIPRFVMVTHKKTSQYRQTDFISGTKTILETTHISTQIYNYVMEYYQPSRTTDRHVRFKRQNSRHSKIIDVSFSKVYERTQTNHPWRIVHSYKWY